MLLTVESKKRGYTMNKKRVFIVDDHGVFCESLAFLLSIRGEAEIVGTATTGEEAVKKIEILRPDVVLMDIEMKGLDGIGATRKLKEKFPEVKVIMLTMHSEEQYIFEAIKAGANGYVLKDYSCSSIIEAIKSVSRNDAFFDPRSSGKVLAGLKTQFGSTGKVQEVPLSRREIEILKLIAEGHINKEISTELCISIHTVRNHIANIFSKIECNTRTKAINEAHRRNLI
jgi:DNA-binding NarL/FixJ family response regulator